MASKEKKQDYLGMAVGITIGLAVTGVAFTTAYDMTERGQRIYGKANKTGYARQRNGDRDEVLETRKSDAYKSIEEGLKALDAEMRGLERAMEVE